MFDYASQRPVGVTMSDARRSAPISSIDILPLLYIGLPTLIYLLGWIKPVYGLTTALLMVASFMVMVGRPSPQRMSMPLIATVVVVLVAVIWSILGGVGHLVYANFDWEIRDAVLLDLVRKSWPVVYDYGPRHIALLLRAPTGMYLPAALMGKAFGIRAAELTMLVWIAMGVLLTFALMLRGETRLRIITIRLAVFIVFSGMDIVGAGMRGDSTALGEHIEWWAYLFQYPAMTTQLFWAPGHALPGWIVVAWLIGRGERPLPVPLLLGVVALIPMWSPLAAIGVAPIVGVAVVKELVYMRAGAAIRAVLDLPMIACVLISALLVYPYLTLGTEILDSGFNADVRFVGEDFAARYVEFVVLEFALIAVLLIRPFRRDPLLFAAIGVLLLLPIYHFGPANDLAMRASNPPLAYLVIRLGQWLATRARDRWDSRARAAAVVLLAIGAATPFLEVSRLFTMTRWSMNTEDDLIEASHGRSAAHYLTFRDQSWPERFMKP